jgi:hypothetical protein
VPFRQKIQSERHFSRKKRALCSRKKGTLQGTTPLIFTKSTNSNFQFSLLFESRIGTVTFLKHCYWLVEQKYKTHVTMKDLIYEWRLTDITDRDELYCYSIMSFTAIFPSIGYVSMNPSTVLLKHWEKFQKIYAHGEHRDGHCLPKLTIIL